MTPSESALFGRIFDSLFQSPGEWGRVKVAFQKALEGYQGSVFLPSDCRAGRKGVAALVGRVSQGRDGVVLEDKKTSVEISFSTCRMHFVSGMVILFKRCRYVGCSGRPAWEVASPAVLFAPRALDPPEITSFGELLSAESNWIHKDRVVGGFTVRCRLVKHYAATVVLDGQETGYLELDLLNGYSVFVAIRHKLFRSRSFLHVGQECVVSSLRFADTVIAPTASEGAVRLTILTDTPATDIWWNAPWSGLEGIPSQLLMATVRVEKAAGQCMVVGQVEDGSRVLCVGLDQCWREIRSFVRPGTVLDFVHCHCYPIHDTPARELNLAFAIGACLHTKILVKQVSPEPETRASAARLSLSYLEGRLQRFPLQQWIWVYCAFLILNNRIGKRIAGTDNLEHDTTSRFKTAFLIILRLFRHCLGTAAPFVRLPSPDTTDSLVVAIFFHSVAARCRASAAFSAAADTEAVWRRLATVSLNDAVTDTALSTRKFGFSASGYRCEAREGLSDLLVFLQRDGESRLWVKDDSCSVNVVLFARSGAGPVKALRKLQMCRITAWMMVTEWYLQSAKAGGGGFGGWRSGFDTDRKKAAPTNWSEFKQLWVCVEDVQSIFSSTAPLRIAPPDFHREGCCCCSSFKSEPHHHFDRVCAVIFKVGQRGNAQFLEGFLLPSAWVKPQGKAEECLTCPCPYCKVSVWEVLTRSNLLCVVMIKTEPTQDGSLLLDTFVTPGDIIECSECAVTFAHVRFGAAPQLPLNWLDLIGRTIRAPTDEARLLSDTTPDAFQCDRSAKCKFLSVRALSTAVRVVSVTGVSAGTPVVTLPEAAVPYSRIVYRMVQGMTRFESVQDILGRVPRIQCKQQRLVHFEGVVVKKCCIQRTGYAVAIVKDTAGFCLPLHSPVGEAPGICCGAVLQLFNALAEYAPSGKSHLRITPSTVMRVSFPPGTKLSAWAGSPHYRLFCISMNIVKLVKLVIRRLESTVAVDRLSASQVLAGKHPLFEVEGSFLVDDGSAQAMLFVDGPEVWPLLGIDSSEAVRNVLKTMEVRDEEDQYEFSPGNQGSSVPIPLHLMSKEQRERAFDDGEHCLQWHSEHLPVVRQTVLCHQLFTKEDKTRMLIPQPVYTDGHGATIFVPTRLRLRFVELLDRPVLARGYALLNRLLEAVPPGV